MTTTRQPHSPFNRRSSLDTVCLWFDDHGRPRRQYCTYFRRLRDGSIQLFRSKNGKPSVITAPRAAIVMPLIHIQTLESTKP